MFGHRKVKPGHPNTAESLSSQIDVALAEMRQLAIEIRALAEEYEPLTGEPR